MLRLRWRSLWLRWPRSMLACFPFAAIACVNSLLQAHNEKHAMNFLHQTQCTEDRAAFIASYRPNMQLLHLMLDADMRLCRPVQLKDFSGSSFAWVCLG